MNLLLTTRINPNKYQSTSPVFLRDTKLKGFAIKVNPSGSHKYIAEMRRDGKTKRCTLGSTELMSLSEAKEEARNFLSNVNVSAPSNEMSLSQLLEEYLIAKSLKESTAKDYRRTLEYVFKPLDRDISSITNVHVKQWYLSYRKTPAQADRGYRVLNGMYNYAMQMCYISINPFIIVKTIRYKFKPRDTYLEPVKALPAFWKALCSYKGRVTSDCAVKMIKLYLMYGLRKSEIYKAELVDDYIRIPATKNGSTHILPIISSAPTEILRDASNLSRGVRYVIDAVCKEANLPHISLHSLRRTTASLCAYLGVGLADIKKLLNHSSGGDVTLRHYIRYQPDYLVPVMQKIEAYYRGIV